MKKYVEWAALALISYFVWDTLAGVQDVQSKVVGKTPNGFHREYFQEWLDHCYPEPNAGWCGDAFGQPLLIEKFGDQTQTN